MKTVKITITPKGISIEGQGFVGTQCEDAINNVKRALGLVVIEDAPKPEYFELNNDTQMEVQNGNS